MLLELLNSESVGLGELVSGTPILTEIHWTDFSHLAEVIQRGLV